MAIWKVPLTLEMLNSRGENTMVDCLGIRFIEIGDETLTATMPVDHRTIQPAGIMHGGASATLAETVGSVASNCCVDQELYYCVGLDINTSHLKKVREGGFVRGVARPIHLGKMTHVWEVKIFDQKQNLVSQSRLTMFVLSKEASR